MRKSTSVSLDENLLAEARELGVGLSKAAEAGIAEEVRAEKSRRWMANNREALKAYDEEIRKHGLPLEKYRLF